MQSKRIVRRMRAYQRNAVKPDPAKPVTGVSIRAILDDELAKRQALTGATHEELSCRVAAYVKVRHRYIWRTGLVLEEEQTSARETVRQYLDTIGNKYLRMSNGLLDKSDSEDRKAPALEAKSANHSMTDEEEDDELATIISSDDEEPIEFDLQHLEERRKLDPELFQSVSKEVQKMLTVLRQLTLQGPSESGFSPLVANLEQLEVALRVADFAAQELETVEDDETLDLLESVEDEIWKLYKGKLPISGVSWGALSGQPVVVVVINLPQASPVDLPRSINGVSIMIEYGKVAPFHRSFHSELKPGISVGRRSSVTAATSGPFFSNGNETYMLV